MSAVNQNLIYVLAPDLKSSYEVVPGGFLSLDSKLMWLSVCNSDFQNPSFGFFRILSGANPGFFQKLKKVQTQEIGRYKIDHSFSQKNQ